MIHQRNVLAVYYVLAAFVIFILSRVVGSVIVSFLIVAVVSVPIISLIKKILPAPDWYKYEDENSKMTGLNLTDTQRSKD